MLVREWRMGTKPCLLVALPWQKKAPIVSIVGIGGVLPQPMLHDRRLGSSHNGDNSNAFAAVVVVVVILDCDQGMTDAEFDWPWDIVQPRVAVRRCWDA